MERVFETQPQVSPNFDHRTVVEYILANLPNATNQILGDAEAVFHELHFYDQDKEAAFTGLVASGGIDRERFEAAYALLMNSLGYGVPKESEGLRGAEQQTDVNVLKIGELATEQATTILTPETELIPNAKRTQAPTPSRPALKKVSYADAYDPEIDDWQNGALCRDTDPEAFFPEKGSNVASALETCAACNVKTQCYDFAIENREHYGVWGGTTERQREAIFKRKARQDRLRT